MTRRTRILAACLAAAVAGVPIGATSQEVCTPSANVSTFKEGLDNPDALRRGPCRDAFCVVRALASRVE